MEDLSVKSRLLQLREMLSLSQSEFSEHIGITQGALSQIESGKTSLSIGTLKKIFKVYKVNSNWLLNGVGNVFLDDQDALAASPYESPDAVGRIALVREEAHAGYIESCHDLDYIDTLDTYKIPGYENGHYRLFEVEGDSMLPAIFPREIVIAERVDDIFAIENSTLAVVIVDEGIVAKRIYLSDKDPSSLILKSDNGKYKTYQVAIDSLREVWSIEAKITTIFAHQQLIGLEKIESLESDVRKLQQQVASVLTQNSQPEEN